MVAFTAYTYCSHSLTPSLYILLFQYASVEEAVATRTALHGVKWPQSNPKFLSVDFSQQEEVRCFDVVGRATLVSDWKMLHYQKNGSFFFIIIHYLLFCCPFILVSLSGM